MAMGMYSNTDHPVAMTHALVPPNHMNPVINKTISTHRILKNAAAKEVEIMLEEEKRKKQDTGKAEILTAEEKAQYSKDRNREHARSTRLRKKAYVGKVRVGDRESSDE